MANKYETVSRSVTRCDAVDKAVGRAKYGADIRLQGMLQGKILHSPHAHARIVRIDTSRAEKVIGVKAIITGEDTGRARVGRFLRDRTILAQGKVRHRGESVAAVAAVDKDTAAEAVQLIHVDYEELPAVFDSLEAMEPGAPIVHEELGTYFSLTPLHSKGNVLDECYIREGNVEEAWAQADVIHEDSYTTEAVHHSFIQPHEAVGHVDGSGKVTVWSSTKALFGVRSTICQALGLRMSNVQVIGAAVGGDFGGKGNAYLEPICVLLAHKAHAPVSLALSREEEFLCSPMRERSRLRLKLAARKDGTLLGFQSTHILDSGAYNDTFQGFLFSLDVAIGPYRIPHLDVSRYYVYTNNHPTGHFRGPMGMTQHVFATESHLDGLAAKLGMDPVELRLKNRQKDGDQAHSGGTLRHVSIGDTVGAAAEYLRREKKERQKNRGWGIACSQYQTQRFRDIPFISSACVKMNEDGTVVLSTGVIESGGGQHTTLAQIVAEVLKIPYESVTVFYGDTNVVPRDYSTSASQTTYRAGMMVKMASEDLRQQLLQLGADKLRTGVESLELVNGRVQVINKPTVGVAVTSLVREQGALQGTGTALRAKKVAILDEEKDIIDGPSSSAHVAEVEVNPETGNVKVLKYFAVHDVGFAINPQNVEGQIQGAISQGLGYALSEEVVSNNGRVVNPNFIDYKLRGAGDMPPIESAIIEVPSTHGPFGAKGFSEAGLLLSAPAVANAVFDATGVRITSLPITAEKVLKALKEKEARRLE
ncbi:MAG: xanthine dehydrogenase family protein molybdopterin-binding subunit [Dehalococcoidia bacterium]|nr:xanthine dehydrogenase family protein molybdopterin-binding subunit [Dehalococcoidia bacterium]